MCVWQWCSEEITKYISDNLPYAYCEQIGKEIRDISDEIPFEIPDSWEWVRCSVLGAIIRGSGIKRTETVDSGLPCVRYGELYTTYNISFTKTVSFIPKELFEQCKQISYGDVIFTLTGENKPDIAKTIAYLGNSPVAVGGDLAYWTHHGMNPLYLVYFMSSPYAIGRKVNLATGDIIVHISGDKVGSFLIPVPPLAEQNRIVAKINELEPIIQEYHSKEKAVSALNTTFPEALKKSILQEAVQGKLVPQNPDDEPASVLIERIRAEKQALIKAGKIKKDKHESIIVTRDKIPYEIPDSWVWCKLSDLAILENGDRSSKYPVEADYVEIGIPFFGAKDIDGDMMSFQNVRFISQQKYDELGNGKLVDGDIICLLRGSVGKTAKFEANEQFDTGFICAQMLIIRLLDKSLFGYISSYFKSPDYTNYVESKVTGTAVRQMPAKEMGNLLIPLPPLAEQHRIVAKIEEIMPMIERLTLR